MRLATRLTLAVLLLFFLVHIILLASYAASANQRRQSEFNDSVVIAQSVATVVSSYRRDIETTLQAVVRSFALTDVPLTQERIGAELTAVAADYHELRAVFVTDARGIVVASQQASGVGTDLSSRGYVQQLKAGAAAVWSPGLVGSLTGQPTVAYGRAIMDADGQTAFA